VSVLSWPHHEIIEMPRRGWNRPGRGQYLARGTDVSEYKTCSCCGVPKSLDSYSVHKRYGRIGTCKGCAAERQKQRRQADPAHFHAMEARSKVKNQDRIAQRKLDGQARRAAQREAYREEHREELAARELAQRQVSLERKRVADRRYAATHRQEAIEKARRWVLAHPEQARATRASHRVAHAEQIKAYYLAWAAVNRERLAVASRAWRAANPASRIAEAHRRRARKAGARMFGHVSFVEVRQRDRDICWLCKKPVDDKTRSYDHAVALAKQGEHSTRNIRIAHRRCNELKQARDVTHQRYLL
jgi:hypothetical protein